MNNLQLNNTDLVRSLASKWHLIALYFLYSKFSLSILNNKKKHFVKFRVLLHDRIFFDRDKISNSVIPQYFLIFVILRNWAHCRILWETSRKKNKYFFLINSRILKKNNLDDSCWFFRRNNGKNGTMENLHFLFQIVFMNYWTCFWWIILCIRDFFFFFQENKKKLQ